MLATAAVLQWAGIRQSLNSNQCGLASQSTPGTALLFLSGHSVICFCHSVSVFPSPQVTLQKQKAEEQPFVSNLIMQKPGHWQTSQNEPKQQRATKPLITAVLLRSPSFLGQSSLYFLCKVRRLTVMGEEGRGKQCTKIIFSLCKTCSNSSPSLVLGGLCTGLPESKETASSGHVHL